MISSKSRIGKNVEIGDYVVIEDGVEVGDNTYVCPRVMTNNLDTGKIQIGGASTGKNCFLGTNTVLHHGISIGDNCITCAMSFVNKDIPDNEIWIGSPAKYFKMNN